MIGEEWFDKRLYASDRGTMCLIWEYEFDGLSINKFLDKVTDAFTSYCYSVIYADLDREDYKTTLYDYCDSRNLSRINLQQAPFPDDWNIRLETFGEQKMLNDSIERVKKANSNPDSDVVYYVEGFTSHHQKYKKSREVLEFRKSVVQRI